MLLKIAGFWVFVPSGYFKYKCPLEVGVRTEEPEANTHQSSKDIWTLWKANQLANRLPIRYYILYIIYFYKYNKAWLWFPRILYYIITMQLYRLPSSSTDASNSGLLRLLNDPDPLLLGKIAMDWWQTLNRKTMFLLPWKRFLAKIFPSNSANMLQPWW